MSNLLNRLRSKRDEEGAALLSVLILSMFVFIVIASLSVTTLHSTVLTGGTKSTLSSLNAAESGLDDALNGAVSGECVAAKTDEQVGFSYEVYRSAGDDVPVDENSVGVTAGCPQDGDKFLLVRSTGDDGQRETTITSVYRWTALPQGMVNGAVVSGSGTMNLSRLVISGTQGDLVLLDGSFDCNNITRISGDVIVLNGQIRISNACNIEGSVYSHGNVTIANPDVAIAGDVYTLGYFTMSNPATIHGSVYAKGSITLTSGATINGDVLAEGGAQTSLDRANVTGNLVANGHIRAQNNSWVGGDVYSSSMADANFYNVTVNGSVSINGRFTQLGASVIGGNVVATRGGVSNSIAPDTSIGGNLALAGSLSTWGSGPSVGGSTGVNASLPMLSTVWFEAPEEFDDGFFAWRDYRFNAQDWVLAGYQVIALSSCDFQNSVEAREQVNQQTQNTVFDLRGCMSRNMYGATFNVQADIAFITPGHNAQQIRVTSADGEAHRFDMIVDDLEDDHEPTCAGSTLNIYNAVTDSNIKSFFYSPCSISFGGTSSLTGQIYAGTASYNGGGGMELVFERLALPGFPSATTTDSEATYEANATSRMLPVLVDRTEL